MPYIYSLAGKTYFDDYTIMRPMVMDFGSDKNTLNLQDQYMFGPALLVAPVYKYGARSREVYFPENTVWHDFYTGKRVDGGQTMTVDAPYGRIPLFVRAGSILPMGGDIQSTAEESTEPITLIVYAGVDGAFTLYEDEGTNYNYEKGRYSMIPMKYDSATSTLSIGDRKGSYDGMKENRVFNVVKIDAASPRGASHNLQGKYVSYDGKAVSLKL